MENISPNNDKSKENDKKGVFAHFSEEVLPLVADLNKEPVPSPGFYQPIPGAYERIFEIMSESV